MNAIFCKPMLNGIKRNAGTVREFNPFDLWVWLEFSTVPSDLEKRYVEECSTPGFT